MRKNGLADYGGEDSLVSGVGFTLLLLMKPDWRVWQLFLPMMLLGAGTSPAMPGVANLISGLKLIAVMAMLMSLIWWAIG